MLIISMFFLKTVKKALTSAQRQNRVSERINRFFSVQLSLSMPFKHREWRNKMMGNTFFWIVSDIILIYFWKELKPTNLGNDTKTSYSVHVSSESFKVLKEKN